MGSRALENLVGGGYPAMVVLLTRARGHTGDGLLINDSV